MHPLAGDLSVLKDSEIESKIQDLTKKYFQTYNMDIKTQIASLLEDYNSEISKRRQEQLKKMMDSRDKSLDKLIKVD
jgi:tartrate dehydratase alpha subunit/fumarate hydratase class I-like protein